MLEITGVNVSESALNDTQTNVNILTNCMNLFFKITTTIQIDRFKFARCDILGFSAQVKHMNLVDIADGKATFYEALEREGAFQDRLMSVALEKFKVIIIFELSLPYLIRSVQVAARKMRFHPDLIIGLGERFLVNYKRTSKEDLLDKAKMGKCP